jgi:ferric-dicitrate binding protein FerR (iron transport regulator)
MLRRSTLTRTVRTLLSAAMAVVCLLPLQGQQFDSTARVIEQVGQVSTMDGGYLTALSVGNVVKQRQLIVTGPDGYARFRVVNDGSTFEVFPNSQVVFRPTLGNWKNLLDIVLGRIKVFIQHEPNKPNYNDVSSPTAVVSVRGTIFDVVVNDSDTTVVSVDEGLVQVRNSTAVGEVYLHPGETTTVIRNQPLVARAIDKSGLLQAGYRAVREALWQVMLGRRQPGGIPGVGAGGTQADKGKGGTTPGSGPGSGPGTAPSGAPGTAPSGAPASAPGSAPGGG